MTSPLFPVCLNGKYGYINLQGELTIDCQFQKARKFTDGLAAVWVNENQAGFVNFNAEFVITPEYSDVDSFKDGLAAVSKGVDRYGCIDTTGKICVELKFASTGRFSNGVAPVKIGHVVNAGWRLINLQGEIVTPSEWAFVWPNQYGLSGVEKNKKMGFVDTAGKVVVSPIYSKDKNSRFCEEGVAPVRLQNESGIITNTGDYVLSLRPILIGSFSEGYADYYCLEKKLAGYIRTDGTISKDACFDECHAFSEGLACVRFENNWHILNKEFEVVGSFHDKELVCQFHEGLARVAKDGKFGFLNSKGDIVVDFKYTNADDFENGLAQVSFGNKKGYIDRSGKEIWNPTN